MTLKQILSTFTDKLEDKITEAFAKKTHTHSGSDIKELPASKLTGTVPLENLPHGALERLVKVTDDAARFALTTEDIQKGDTVKVNATGKMYIVIDDTKLSTEAGYEIYTAGAASSVPWGGVTGKPSAYTPESHTHTKSQINDFPLSMKNPAALDVKINGTAVVSYDGAAAKELDITLNSLGLGEVTEADIDEMMTGKFNA